MSKVRGIFPLFLATVFGVGNGLWVFGPAFKEQQEEKERLTKKALELESPSQETQAQAEALRAAEAAASRTSATESALKSIEPSSSWWPKLGLWSTSNPNTEKPITKDNTKPGGNRPDNNA